MHQTKELEGNFQKITKLTVPGTSSERPLEHSEIANSKNVYFVIQMSLPKIKQSQPKTKRKFRPYTKFS